jgi:hypothetical protein
VQEAFLAVGVIIVVMVIGELVRRNRRMARCPACGSTSLLVLADSNVMRECNDCGRTFSV